MRTLKNNAANQTSYPPSTEGPLLIASCRSGTMIASKVVQQYRSLFSLDEGIRDLETLMDINFSFSDGETCIRLDKDVNGRDVFLFQALQDPTSERSVDENYMAFFMAVRTFHEWGANRVTGVLPYLAYARQDKHTPGKREPISVELMAELSIEAGLNRLIVWAPHDNRVHGFYGKVPVDTLQANQIFKKQYAEKNGQKNVIGVAPDAGAAAFMIPFCRNMNINCAVTAKYRPEPEKTAITDIMGNFEGMDEAIVLDDMINTGGTVEAVVKKLYTEKGIKKIWLGVSHFLGANKAKKRLIKCHEKFGLEKLIVTNSVPLKKEFKDLGFVNTVSLEVPFANAIHCIHHNLPLT